MGTKSGRCALERKGSIGKTKRNYGNAVPNRIRARKGIKNRSPPRSVRRRARKNKPVIASLRSNPEISSLSAMSWITSLRSQRRSPNFCTLALNPDLNRKRVRNSLATQPQAIDVERNRTGERYGRSPAGLSCPVEVAVGTRLFTRSNISRYPEDSGAATEIDRLR